MTIQEQIKSLIPENLPKESHVWIYQSSRPFSEQQSLEVAEQLKQFYLQWQVHGTPVAGWAGLLFNRFIVFIADEADQKISGCSMDTAERVLKSLERQYETTLFDRLSITFLIDGKPQVLPLNQVQYALDHGKIQPTTLLFNNTVNTRGALIERWLQPLSESWLMSRISLPKA